MHKKLTETLQPHFFAMIIIDCLDASGNLCTVGKWLSQLFSYRGIGMPKASIHIILGCKKLKNWPQINTQVVFVHVVIFIYWSRQQDVLSCFLVHP